MYVLLADACHGSYGDNCYVTVKQEKSHDDAVQWCGRIGGQLVDIQNHDENEAVTRLAAGLLRWLVVVLHTCVKLLNER